MASTKRELGRELVCRDTNRNAEKGIAMRSQASSVHRVIPHNIPKIDLPYHDSFRRNTP